MQQPPALTPQQEAIRQVRQRYEQGDLTFDHFEYALNAILQAQTPEECEAIVSELPSSPINALDVLSPQPAAPALSSSPRHTRWWVAFMGGVRRMTRPWKLADQMIGVAVMGGIEADLSLAALPHQGVIRLFMMWGGVKLFVPRSVDVSVRSFVMLGGVNALGEGSGGVISFNHEESQALKSPGVTTPQLEIQIFALMGGAEVIQVDGPVITGAGLLGGPGQQIVSVPYDRNTLHSIRQSERQARRDLRRQGRHLHDYD